MLEFIRERAQGWIAWVIVSLLIATFALWGIQEYTAPEVTVNVAEVNGTEISADQFQQAYFQQRARLQQMLGQNFDPDLFDEKTMKQDVLDGMIEREVLVQHAAESGMRVGDVRLANYIRTIPELQTNGQFDKELYNRLLRSQGLSVQGFEQAVRGDLLQQQLRQGIMDTAFATRLEMEALLRLREQQRELGYLTVPVAQYTQDVTVDDAAIESFYNENREQYRTPEQVSVEYLELSVGNMAAGVDVTEENLRQYYEERKRDFSVPEERQARHILIQVDSDAAPADLEAARAKAQDILARLREGESFAELAREVSQDPGSAQNGGDLGFFGRGIMDKAFEDASFGLAVGEVSEPVRSAFGYHIIKLEAVRGGQSKSFEEVRAQLERDLKRQRAEEQYFALAEQLYNLTFENPDNLNVAAQALGLQVRTTELFSRDRGFGIAANPKVRAAAFADDVLQRGNNSEPIELSTDHEVVIRVKERKAEGMRPLDEVREDIRQTLRHQAALKKAQEAGKTLVSQLQQGVEMTELAKDANLKWERPGLVGRVSPEVNPEIIKEAFRLPRPQEGKPVYGGKTLSSGDFAVVAVFEVKDGDPIALDDATKQNATDTLVRNRASQEFQAYAKALEAKANIKRYPDKL